MSKRKKSAAGRPQELVDPVQRLVILEAHQSDWLASQGAQTKLGASGFIRQVIQELIDRQTASAGSVAPD